ncbi:hypothetical protein IF650_16210 [Cellulosimicrobium terreum]|nr:hypothetical protein [Cellulosimicrobium terreum]
MALVVALALAGGRQVSVGALVDDLWGPGAPRDPRAALQSLVSRLRRDSAPGVLVSRAGGYALGVPSDLDRARHALAVARSASADGTGAAADVAGTVRAALELWEGDEPGAEVPDAVGHALRAEAARLRDELTNAWRAAAARAGDHATVVRLASEALDRDETDEAAALDLMGALVATGRREEAVATYTRVRHALVRDLGTDPGPALERAAADLSAQPVSAMSSRTAVRQPAAPPTPRPVEVRGVRAAPDPLVGRDEAVQAIAHSLARSRLVTVLGPGGLGKTRVVHEVARYASTDGSSDLVAIVELAGVREDADVLVALADGLGISSPGQTGRLVDRLAVPELAAQVQERLRGRATLLVLDNCEHVAGGAARWVSELLAARTGLRVLTTSRAPLRVPGEQVFPLAPLEADDGRGPAVRLFTDRARAARPGASLPVDVVARLCDRLDGLPLAIELAAARVRTLSVEDVERHLDERFTLLRSGDRLAPERHRTLEAVIEWSWQLLHPDEQDLLRRTCLLPDGFTAATAQEVAQVAGMGPWEVLDALDGLVTQSLLTVTDLESGTRYRMLETVREFGALRLAESGIEDEARGAVGRWAARLAQRRAEDLVGGDQVAALAELHGEQDNLLFALRQAVRAEDPAVVVRVFVALAAVWAMRGAEDQAAGLTGTVLEVVTGWTVPDEDVQATVLALAVGAASAAFGRPESSARSLGRLRRLLRRDGVGHRTRAFVGLLLLRSPGELPAMLERLRDDEDPVVVLLACFMTAQTTENDGRMAETRVWALRTHELAVARGDVMSRAMSTMFLASCASEAGDAAEAERWTRLARPDLVALGAAGALQQLDWVELSAAVSIGELDRAERALAAMEGASRPTSPADVRSTVSMARAEVAALRGDIDAALALYEQAASGFDVTERMSPWYLMVVAAWTAHLVAAGSPRAAEAAARLRERMGVERDRRPTFSDLPVMGTVVVALGAQLAVGPGGTMGPDVAHGALLIALAERMGSRQDLPCLRHDTVWGLVRATAGEDVVRRAREEVDAVRHDDLAPRVLEVLERSEGRGENA